VPLRYELSIFGGVPGSLAGSRGPGSHKLRLHQSGLDHAFRRPIGYETLVSLVRTPNVSGITLKPSDGTASFQRKDVPVQAICRELVAWQMIEDWSRLRLQGCREFSQADIV
jgi:hypothetical protein